MRKSIIALFLSMIMLSGCVSSAVKKKLSRNAAQLDGYVKRMDAEETSVEEDKDLIRVMRIWTWSMNWAENDETPPDDIRFILEAGAD